MVKQCYFENNLGYAYYEITLTTLLETKLEDKFKIPVLGKPNHNISFEEPELWYILCGIISLLTYLNEKKIKYNEIIPNNIFITDEGKIKFHDGFLSWTE